MSMSEKEIAWDLTEIFTGCDDPNISKTMDSLMEKADEIINQFKGKINEPNFTESDFNENSFEKIDKKILKKITPQCNKSDNL